MNLTTHKTPIIVAVVLSSLLLCGCNEELRMSDIYGASLGGALVGGIVGYQSHEEGEGAAIGAAICGIGELLDQLDDLKDKDKEEIGEIKFGKIDNEENYISAISSLFKKIYAVEPNLVDDLGSELTNLVE